MEEVTVTAKGSKFLYSNGMLSKVRYPYAAFTKVGETPSDTREVLSFHKTLQAAQKGNGQIAKQYHHGVRVVEIKEV